MTQKRVQLIKSSQVSAPSSPAPEEPEPLFPSHEGSIDVVQAWTDVLARLDDDNVHQRFIRSALASKRLDFALESYQRLQGLKPEATNLDRYIKQVGKMMELSILGANSRRESPETILRRPLRMMYTLLIGVAVLLALYATVRLVQHALNL